MTDIAWMILGLFALGVFGIFTARNVAGRIITYGGSLILCAGLLCTGFLGLTAPVQHLHLPLGLPVLGSYLRLDALRREWRCACG